MRGSIASTEISRTPTTGARVDSMPERCNKSLLDVSYKKEDDHTETQLQRVGRMLMDSLSKGKMRRSKIFGAALEDLPVSSRGLPKIVERLASHLEQYGLKQPNLFASGDKKQGKTVEKLKISFDRIGDADLRNCTGTDACIVASLLKLWLDELPHPLIPNRITSRLKILIDKYERKELYDLNFEFSNVLLTCSKLNLGVLYIVVGLLDKYFQEWYPAAYVDQLPEMFAKILIGRGNVKNVEIISMLVHKFREIFDERIVEKVFKIAYTVKGDKIQVESRRCNHDHPETELNLSADKLLRSNSEEKLNSQNDYGYQDARTQNSSIRRVNSHEDCRSNLRNSCRLSQIPRTNMELEQNPLKKNGVFMTALREKYDEPVLDNYQRRIPSTDKEVDVLVAPQPFLYHADSRIPEEIRNAERSDPQFNIYRSNYRRKRNHQDCSTKPKRQWNTCQEDSDSESIHSVSSDFSNSNSRNCDNERLGNSDTYANEHSERFGQHARSCNVSDSSFDESIDDCPVRRTTASHFSNFDSKISYARKHLQRVRKKMKRFEEDFGDKSGAGATVKKASYPENTRMGATIVFLQNNLKHFRREPNENYSQHLLVSGKPNIAGSSIRVADVRVSNKDKEDAFQDTTKLKFRESTMSSELPTINEDETMDFDSSPASTNSESLISSLPCPLVCNVTKNDFPVSNIHELSLPELMTEYKTTQEEKKKLRNRVRMYEQEIENHTINDSKHCIHSLRYRYKNTKAKLKLLEALLMKIK